MKTSKTFFQIVAVMFLFIGLMHTKVHFAKLVTPELAERLNFDIQLMEKPEDVYKMWQGFSFIMGVCFIIIGLLNLVFVKNLGRENPVPILAIFVMMLLMAAVTYSGANFFGAAQFYGGLFGLVMLLISLILNLKNAR